MQNKTYKLLKDLPFAKAGEELYLKFSEDSEFFLVYKGTNKAYTAELNPEFIDNFDEWFEEVRTFGEYYYVIDVGHVGYLEDGNYRPNDTLGRMKIGNIFKTRYEAEKYLEYLKAKEVIKQDTKGFKPDWTNYDEKKYLGFWDIEKDSLDWLPRNIFIEATIYFKSREDIEESFEKHPNEWKAYLTYGQ